MITVQSFNAEGQMRLLTRVNSLDCLSFDNPSLALTFGNMQLSPVSEP